MTTKMRAGVVVAALMFGVAGMRAQEPAPPASPASSQPAENQASLPTEARTGPRGGGVQARQVELLTKELSLTPEQVTKLKSIDADTEQQLMALRNDTVSSREEKRPKMAAIRDGQQVKVKAMLTEEQKPKYEALLAKMQERRRDGAGGPPPQE